jgi:hypothetical protein
MKRSHGLRGINKSASGKWSARIKINGRRSKRLGCFTTKQQAAAAYDGAARLNNGNAVCNYDSQTHADEAIREARQINLLRNTGCLQLIMEAHGPAKYEEALVRQVWAQVPIWRRLVAADNLRKAEKTAARERTRVRATEREQRREQRC